MDKFSTLYEAGRVRRWHTHEIMAADGQDNGNHQWGVTMIILYLFPYTRRELILAALTHDVGEKVTGDLAGPFKRKNPALAAKFETLESQARDEICPFDHSASLIGGWEALKMADKLEAVLRVKYFRPDLLNRIEWREQIDEILELARKFGCRNEVIEMLKGDER